MREPFSNKLDYIAMSLSSPDAATNLNIHFEPGKAPGGASASWAGNRPMSDVETSVMGLTAGLERSSISARSVHSRQRTTATLDANQLEARLFDARASAKLVAASLAMHLPGEWRSKVNKQVDELLSLEDWDSTEALLQPTSMQTFLRFVIFANVRTVPSLGMSPAGFVLAAWRRDTRRLTIEFMPGDRCRLAISHFNGDDDSIVTFAGTSSKARIFLEHQQFPFG